jgi:xanthine dehydrogenase accessory factor
MTKKSPAPLPVTDIPIIGLGPAIRCGRDAVFVVETHRQARLGALLTTGEAAPNSGVPGPLGGETSRRLLRAPVSGQLQPRRQIGDLVRASETVASIAGCAIQSQIDGLLRGLIHPEAELSPGEKVGDVDPRGRDVDPALVSHKCLAVAGGVLEGLLRLGVTPPDSGR